MTPKYYFEIPEFRYDLFEKPMRSIYDHIRLVAHFLQDHVFLKRTSTEPDCPFLSINQSGRGRLNVHFDSRILSVCFPLTYSDSFDQPFSFKDYGIVDQAMTSSLILVANSTDKNKHDTLFQVMGGLTDNDISVGIDRVEFLSRLVSWFFFEESGHVRFEHDRKNMDGEIHPEFHLDINYSNSTSFKIGLRERIENSRFDGMFDSLAPCMYLS